MSNKTVALIGSGPSALGGLAALTEAPNHKITVFDAGLPLSHSIGKDKLFRKTVNGSSAYYADFPFGSNICQHQTDLQYSFTQGGLSNVWGATLGEFSKDFLAKNFEPEELEELDQGYKAMWKLLPGTQVIDSLETHSNTYPVKSKFVMSKLMAHIFRRSTKLKSSKIHFVPSILAVENQKNNCVRCSNCLTGCPLNLIWSSTPTFESIVSSNHVKINSGCRVNRLVTSEKGIFIESITTVGEIKSDGPFDQVFLATGPIETYRILADSEIIHGDRILKQTDTFYLPFLSLNIRNFIKPEFGLSQIACKIKSHSNDGLYLQLYQFSDSHLKLMKSKYRFLKFVPLRVMSLVFRHFILAIGYMSEGDSDSISLSIHEKTVLLSNTKPLHNKGKILEIISKSVKQEFRKLKLFPLMPLLEITPAGNGVHIGGSLIHGHDVTSKGRCLKNTNIVVLDSSVLPNLEPGPITLTLMANSYRIASHID